MTRVQIVNDIDGAASATESLNVDRRPPWSLIAVLLLAVGAVVIVTMRSSDDATDTTTESTAAPATTVAEPPLPSSSTSTADAQTTTSTTIATASAGDVVAEFLPVDADVVSALPPNGIDAWFFQYGSGQLLRTDLVTGTQTRLDLDAQQVVAVGSKLAVLESGGIAVVDIASLDTVRLELAEPVRIVAHDDARAWVLSGQGFFDPNIESAFVLLEVDLATGAITEIPIDPFGIGFTVAGALDGTIRVHTALVGTWQIGPDRRTRLPDPVLAGTHGGTIELRCGDEPGDCSPVIVDLRTGAERVVAITSPFTAVLSPRLDAYVDGFTLRRLDGDETTLGNGGSTGEWAFSPTGRFLSDGRGQIIDIDGEFERIQMTSGVRVREVGGSLVVERTAPTPVADGSDDDQNAADTTIGVAGI